MIGTYSLAVVGSRNYFNEDAFDMQLSEFLASRPHINRLISGGAVGVDSMARTYASRFNWPMAVYKPDYEKHGKIAPLIRNCEIAKNCDEMLAFWDGKSRGTMHAMQQAVKSGKKVTIISVAEELDETDDKKKSA